MGVWHTCQCARVGETVTEAMAVTEAVVMAAAAVAVAVAGQRY